MKDKTMKIDYDKEADAAYIYLKYPIKAGEAKKQKEINNNVILDFDAKGKLLGVEILNARKILNKRIIDQAAIITA